MRKAHVDDTNQPDRVTDALISRGLLGADEGVGCPGPSLLAGIHEGSLEPDETERWMTHLAACQRCQATLGALARAEEDAGPAVVATNQPVLETSRAPTRDAGTQLIDEIEDRLTQDAAAAETAPRRGASARPPAAQPAARFTVPMMLRSPEDAIQWRAEPNGDIERTDDGGLSWRVPERVIAGAAPSAVVAWMVGEQGLVLRTLDGEQWARLSPPTAATFIAVEAADGRRATVTTDDGLQFRTIDAGTEWTRLP